MAFPTKDDCFVMLGRRERQAKSVKKEKRKEAKRLNESKHSTLTNSPHEKTTLQ